MKKTILILSLFVSACAPKEEPEEPTVKFGALWGPCNLASDCDDEPYRACFQSMCVTKGANVCPPSEIGGMEFQSVTLVHEGSGLCVIPCEYGCSPSGMGCFGDYCGWL